MSIYKYVKRNSANLDETELKKRVEGINTAIESGYGTILTQEKNYVTGALYDAVRKAYNTANANVTDEETKKEIEAKSAEITEIIGNAEKVSALKPGKFDAEAYESLKTELLGYEKELCDLIEFFNSKYSEDQDSSVAKSTAALEENFNTVSADIATGKENAGELIKEEYAVKYDNLQKELDAVKSAWEAAGSMVIAQEGNFRNSIEEIANKLEALNEAAAKAEQEAEKKAEALAVYNNFTEELNELEKQFQDVETMIRETYQDESYYPALITIPNNILRDRSWLESNKENLTSISRLPVSTTTISSNINNLKIAATRNYTTGKFTEADNVYNNTVLQFNNLHIVPSVRAELEESLAENATKLQSLKYAYNDPYTYLGYEDLVEIYTGVQGIIDAIKGISAEAVDNSFIPGDVELNPDGQVTTVDVQMLLNWVGEGVTYEDLYADNARQACAADINGDDKLNIGDVTADINLAMGEQTTAEIMAASFRAPAEGSNTWAVELIGKENGIKHYALHINNNAAFVAGQLDLVVSGSGTIADVNTAERTESHNLYLFDHLTGETRVILASMENALIAGNGGAVLYIDVQGDGNIEVQNALFADRNANTYVVEKNGSSFLDTLIDGANNMKERIYDTTGKMMNRLQNGINIIRKGNGKATKEYHRK